MKPIKLTIAGLNSFKEEQTIDFEKLSDLCMFGIFGKTGSGKSSILDAMTLALFGTVVRADNNKQGIINQAQASMYVSFTFALGAGPQRRMYRADRTYKTKDHISVNSTRSLLLDITAGADKAVVIAEKEKDVTAYVEKLLGMKADDFTRAVVLPQGSFADFLKMKPSDRRAMLERLFSLEKYGNKLSAKVNSRLTDANLRFSRLDGEQQGLGQASDEHVRAAEQEKAAAIARELDAVKLLEEIQKQYDQASKIYSLQEELASQLAALAQHREQADMVAGLRREIQRAEDAAKVKPLLEERQQLDNELKAANSRRQALADQVQDLQQQDGIFLVALNSAKSVRAEQQPALIARQTRLNDALALETEAAELKVKVAQSELAARTADQQLEAVSSAIRRLNESLESLAREIHEQESFIAANKVQPEYRALVQEATSQADSLERDLKSREMYSRQQQERQQTYNEILNKKTTAEHTAAAAAASLAALTAAEEQARQNCPGDETTLAQQEIDLAKLNGKAKDLTDIAAKLDRDRREAAAAEQQLANAKAKQTSARATRDAAQAYVQRLTEQMTELLLSDHQAMAAALAASLKPGQPCPVCGGADHPAPAAATSTRASDQQKTTLQNAIDLAKQKAKQAETDWQLAESLALNLSAKLNSIQNGLNEHTLQLEEELSALAADWRLDSDKVSLKSLAGLIQTETDKLQAAKNRLTAWRNERETAERQIRTLEQKRAALDSEIAALQAALTAAAAELARTNAESAELGAKVAAAVEELDAVLTRLACQPSADIGLKLNQVASLKADVKKRDHTVEALQTAINQKRARQQRDQQRLEPLRQSEQQLTVSLTQLRTSIAADTRELAAKQAQLRSITQGVPVQVLLEQVRSSLNTLEQAEQSAQEQYNDNQTALQKVNLQLTAAKTQLANLAERVEQIQAVLINRMAELAFAAEADAQSAYREAEVLDGMRQQVARYAETELLLASQCEHLLAKLAGQGVSSAEWEEINQRLAESKAAKERASEQRIAAEQIFNDISARHERWQELENQLVTVRQEHQHLTTLKNLLRSNALVEFMAQEEMDVVVRHASDRLKQLTGNRYGLELASDGSFIIRDDDNAGAKRPVNTLSGGETFQTSLALALALSTQIQLKGEHPLEFFFLDEGFGTLDQSLLETVMTSLERLPLERMTIGLISHVEALKQRMLRRLIVEGAEPNGKGTQVRIEFA